MKVGFTFAILLRMKDNDSYRTRLTLLEKIKNKHDDESWEDFVFYYKTFIYIICRRMNLNHHDSEEIVQKVLLISWKKLPEFNYDGKKTFRGWLCSLTQMCVKDFYRVIKSHNKKLENASKNEENLVSSFSNIDEIAEEEWKSYIASMALMNIKDKFSSNVIDVFQRLTKGESPAQISEEMDIPNNTVAVYKKRVIAKLREEIKRLNYELG